MLGPQHVAVMTQIPETLQEMQSSEMLEKTTSPLKSAFGSPVASEMAVLRTLFVLQQYYILVLSPLYCYIVTKTIRANYNISQLVHAHILGPNLGVHY